MRICNILYCCIFIISFSCSKKNTKSVDNKIPIKANVGISALVMPFTQGDYNVVVSVAKGADKYYFGNPVTISGVHWSFLADLPTKVQVSSDGINWSLIALERNSDLPLPPFWLKYKVNLNQIWQTGMPAIGGGFTSEAGHTTLSSFLFVTNKSADVPIKVQFSDAKTPYNIYANAPSCGIGCVQFSGLLDGMDTPIFVSKADINNYCFGITQGRLPFCVVIDSDVASEKERIKAALPEIYTKLTMVWSKLSQKWGKLPIGDTFAVHTLVVGGCGYQGLEHAAATLLSIGVCDANSFEKLFLHTAVHEMMHAWNAKYIFPIETSDWNPSVFSSDRLRQLYFYEGFSEAMARILLVEEFPALQQYVRTQWNSSLKTVATADFTVGISEFSVKNPMVAYQFGALLLLKLVTESKAIYGMEDTKTRLWSLMNSFQNVDLLQPLSQQRCYTGGMFKLCNTAKHGYTNEELLDTFDKVFALNNWQAFVAAHLQNSFLQDISTFTTWINEIAKATGVELLDANTAKVQFLNAPLDANTWPL